MANYTSMVKVNESMPVYFDHETKAEALDFAQHTALDYVNSHKSIVLVCVEFAVRDNTQKVAIIRGSYTKIEGEVNVHIFEMK